MLHHFIRTLREERGISQDQLAKEIGVSRPTYIQIEKGERELTVSEAQKLAGIFGMELEAFLREKKEEVHVTLPAAAAQKKHQQEERIDVPQERLDIFREVLLYILSQVGAKPNVGETVLYKLLYFIDFDYYEKYEEQLIGAKYIKNHYGPTPVEFKKIVERMRQNGELEVVENKVHDFMQRRYLPRRNPDLQKLTARDIKHIDDVLQRLSDKSARELSDYSHGDMPWKVHKPGEQLEYEYVFYREPPYSVRSYDDDPV